MDRENNSLVVLASVSLVMLFLGFILGACIFIEVGLYDGLDQGIHRTQQWVETCWPNKPAWNTGTPNMCWVNGQRVLVGD